MIRPFDLRDVLLVRQLAERGLPLESRLALTGPQRPFRDALLFYLLASHGMPTLVMRRWQGGRHLRAFGQLRLQGAELRRVQQTRDCRCQARLVMVAVDPADRAAELWPQLLDALTAEAGSLGAHAVLAEVEDNSVYLDYLRQADFSVYARQEIWRLSRPLPMPDEAPLRPVQSVDCWSISQLVANTVPLLIQQVEPLPADAGGLVWLQEGSPLAFVFVRSGAQGMWAQLFLHPQAEERVEDLISQTAAHYSPSSQRPLYCCVRRHQQWLGRPLAELGFELLGSQAVMVRHTAVRLAQPEFQPITVREKGLEVSTPIVHSGDRAETI